MKINQNAIIPYRETLVDKITEVLEKGILSGNILPGTRLSESWVATEFGVSRIPAREALQRLEEMNLLRKSHRGREVIKFSLDEFREIYELKNVVEAYGVMKGAYNAQERDLKEIGATLESMESCLEPVNLMRLRALNARFHDHLVHCSKNTKLIEVYNLRVKQVRWASSLSLTVPDRPRLSVREHQEIFKAFAGRNGRKARELMEEHTNGSMERVLARLKASEKSRSEDNTKAVTGHLGNVK